MNRRPYHDMTDARQTEFDLFRFFERTPDLVFIADKNGFWKKVNPAVVEKLGYTEQELYANPITNFVYQPDKDATIHSRTSMFDGEVLHNFVNRYVKKNGDIIWLEWTSIYFPDKEIVFAIAKDVTERKKFEQEAEEKFITLKSLATHFKSSIEKDRKYFAYELHEEVAQLAAALKLDVNWVAANSKDLSPVFRYRIDNVSTISELLIKKIQKIAFSISPNMLDLLGLNDALKWLSNEFSILNEINCDFESNYDDTDLLNEIKIDFFRICQEALKNVTDHAAANSVKISVGKIDGKLQLSIIDDGKGFNLAAVTRSSGLSSIRSRASSINASLNIHSEPGNGTMICVTVENPS